jgi:hypothetical protein
MTEVSRELATVRTKVERYLKEIVSEYQVQGERFLYRQGSAVVVIHPLQWQEGSTIVRLISPVLSKVARAGNDAMFEEFSELNDRFIFGRFYWTPSKDDAAIGTIFLEHSLLGEYLDVDELASAFVGMAATADKFDDELKAKYGGERWEDR